MADSSVADQRTGLKLSSSSEETAKINSALQHSRCFPSLLHDRMSFAGAQITNLGLNSCSEEIEFCNTAKRLKTLEIDRISSLPDELISLILSFLSTKEAVGTSVLSKRWRSLWALVPVLNFSCGSSKETKSFMRFFRKRVRTLGRSLAIVRLQGYFGPYFGDWVSKVIASGVQELDLCMTTQKPSRIFRHGSLTSIALVSLKLVNVSFCGPMSFHLPCLKILHLRSVGGLSEESMRQLISGCPVVEDVLVSNYYEKTKLPPSLFNSQTLVSLNLGSGVTFDFPSSIHLPHLKILRLQTCELVLDQEFISQLLSECTLLEDFDLNSYGEPTKIPEHMFISKTLVSLKLQGRISLQVPPSVDLPNLRILHLRTHEFVLNPEFICELLSECILLEDLDLKTSSYGEPIKIPDHLFISKTLVSLKLYGKISLQVPPSFHLPNLRILHLGGSILTLDKLLGDLLSGCPVLEEIDLRGLCTTNKESSSTCVLTVESLLVTLGHRDYPFMLPSKLKITAPALKHVRILCGLYDEISWNFPNLQEASFSFDNSISRKLFSAVRNTKVLRLHNYIYGFRCNLPPVNIDFIPKFQHLKCLEIYNPVGFSSYFLPKFLESSANLQALMIDGKMISLDVAWSTPQNVPYCLLHSLKDFGISCFQGLDKETQMVEYILANGRVLETIVIGFYALDAEPKLRAEEKISAIPRCSSASQLKFM